MKNWATSWRVFQKEQESWIPPQDRWKLNLCILENILLLNFNHLQRIFILFHRVSDTADTDCNVRKIHSSDDEHKINEDDFDSQIAAWESQKEELLFPWISQKIITCLLASFDVNKRDLIEDFSHPYLWKFSQKVFLQILKEINQSGSCWNIVYPYHTGNIVLLT